MMLDIRRQVPQECSEHEVNFSGLVGHGIYLVEVSRFYELRNQLGESLEHHCFTHRERCNALSGERRLYFLVGCLAVKNAVVKALGRDNVPENSWRNIDVQKLFSSQPLVVLDGEVQNVAHQLGINAWMLSVSRTSSYVMASAIALGSNKATERKYF